MNTKSIVVGLSCLIGCELFPMNAYAQKSEIGCLEILHDPNSSAEVRAACIEFLIKEVPGRGGSGTSIILPSSPPPSYSLPPELVPELVPPLPLEPSDRQEELNNEIIREQETLKRERAAIKKERDAFIKERDAFREERDAFNANRED